MFETFRFTSRILRKRPLRSLLTILQMGLGVWVVAIILSLNFQATGTLEHVNQSLGSSLAKLSVSQEREMEGGGVWTAFTTNFRLSDLERLKESSLIEQAFFYESQWEQTILVGDLAYSVATSLETTEEYATAVDLKLAEGQFFTKADREQQNRVVLLSEVIAKQLFPNQKALGKSITLGRYGEDRLDYEIIGVYKPPSSLLEFFLTEPYLIFPLGVSNYNWASVLDEAYDRSYGQLVIKSSPGRVYEAVAEAQLLLGDRALDEMTVRGEYFADANRYVSEGIRQITLFLGAFAFVAILISAIGILSIMLVSVVERTKEIGLRQALGASKGVIVRQILNESLVFSILGSGLGLVVAYFSAEALVSALVQEFTYPKLTNLGGLHPKAALIACSLAVLVGQVFGLYPAMQGAKLPPVEAIREG